MLIKNALNIIIRNPFDYTQIKRTKEMGSRGITIQKRVQWCHKKPNFTGAC